jgi:hypothetical protein
MEFAHHPHLVQPEQNQDDAWGASFAFHVLLECTILWKTAIACPAQQVGMLLKAEARRVFFVLMWKSFLISTIHQKSGKPVPVFGLFVLMSSLKRASS